MFSLTREVAVYHEKRATHQYEDSSERGAVREIIRLMAMADSSIFQD